MRLVGVRDRTALLRAGMAKTLDRLATEVEDARLEPDGLEADGARTGAR
jgi:hypothetical protein